MKHDIETGQLIFFQDEKLPMTVRVCDERFAICTRKLHRRHDADLLWFKVEMQAYLSFTEAYNALKDEPVYCICDFQEMKKAPDNYGCKFNYLDDAKVLEALAELQSGEMELSRRHGADLRVDWDRTNQAS